jgi:hypothetical protein
VIQSEKPNPFAVLKLPISAGQAEIVSRAEELYVLAATGEEEQLIRWAAEQLRTNPRTRLEYELFELPETQYIDEDWELFLRQHRRRETLPPPYLPDAPELTLTDIPLAALLETYLVGMLEPEESDLEQVLASFPLVPRYTFPFKEEEIIFG